MFVYNDQSTAAISIADISSRRGSTDMNFSLQFYFHRVATCGSEEVIESLIAIFQRRKST